MLLCCVLQPLCVTHVCTRLTFTLSQTVYLYVPANTPIIGQIGIIFSFVSVIYSVYLWCDIAPPHPPPALRIASSRVSSRLNHRMIGIRVEYSERLNQLSASDGDRSSVRQALGDLLPQPLVQKLGRRRMMNTSCEERQLGGKDYRVM